MSLKPTALIPLRGGSSSIPRKNIKPLRGRPLCDWTIRAALDSKVFESVWVSTDDDEIAAISERAGAKVHRRAPETATSTASSESAVFDFLDAREGAGEPIEVVSLVQATSPLTQPEDFQQAWQAFESAQADALVTVTRQHRFLWKADGTAVNYDPARRPRRQDWDGELMENGAFYFTRVATLRETGSRLAGKTVVHEMPAISAYEIDEPDDWIILEELARRYGYHPASNTKIKLFVMDADGVLTDGQVFVSEQGEAFKGYHHRDGHGLALLRKSGVSNGLITGESSGFAQRRAEKLKLPYTLFGTQDKFPVLDAWRQELGLEWSQVAYIGDDLPDIPCLNAAGVGACPSDAPRLVKSSADYICTRRGGQAVVREFIDYLFDQGKIEEHE